jgi:ATP-dependent RNA helicase DDX35
MKYLLLTQCTSAQTEIKYMTDGMLMRETLSDPLLSRYSVIIIDEAHERSIATDLLVGLVKKIQKKRPELRVVISSATMDAEQFRAFFNTNTTPDVSKDTSVIYSLPGRVFPVDVYYMEHPAEDYIKDSVETVFSIHQKEKQGDILLFLTGREEVDTACQMIQSRQEYACLIAVNDLDIFMRCRYMPVCQLKNN